VQQSLATKDDAAVLNNDNNDESGEEVVEPQIFKYAAPYANIIGKDDPFLNVDIVLHRNGEPDPCSRQMQTQTQTQQQLDNNYGSGISMLGNIAKRLGISSSTTTSNDDTTTTSSSAKKEEDSSNNKKSPLSQSILRSTEHFAKPLSFDSKYDLDAVLTHAFASITPSSSSLFKDHDPSSCGPTWEEQDPNNKPHYLDQVNAHSSPIINTSFSSLIKYCDMGIDRTPLQPDHNKLVRLGQVKSLPCTFHTREGVRVDSLKMLVDLAREVQLLGQKKKSGGGECSGVIGDDDDNQENDATCTAATTTTTTSGNDQKNELHLYAVSAGRVFMFAPKHIGEIFELPHVQGPKGLPVSLQVMSLQPRVFDIYNFFDRAESAAIVEKALKETSETHRMKRSSTGASGYNLNSKRTSENGFDTHGKEAQVVKRRCMHILGFDEYEESLTDGLQVLRYNKTTGYFPHLDWIDDPRKREEHNFDSAGVGSNRFATILLYMSDLEKGDGGETLFSHGWPVGQAEEDHVELDDAIDALRASGDVEGMLKRDSWEETMVARCRSRLAVRPHSSRAVLFYSQHPDGSVDTSSLHGGCPVITDQPKWAANLWAWNSIRGGFPGSPKNEEVVEKNRAANKSPENDLQKNAKFVNTKSDERMRHAQLFFQDTFWGKYGFDDPPLGVNTFQGHQWHVQVDGKVVKSFTIGKEKKQEFHI